MGGGGGGMMTSALSGKGLSAKLSCRNVSASLVEKCRLSLFVSELSGLSDRNCLWNLDERDVN